MKRKRPGNTFLLNSKPTLSHHFKNISTKVQLVLVVVLCLFKTGESAILDICEIKLAADHTDHGTSDMSNFT